MLGVTDDELNAIERRCANARVGCQIATVAVGDVERISDAPSMIYHLPKITCECEMQDLVRDAIPALIAEVRRLRKTLSYIADTGLWAEYRGEKAGAGMAAYAQAALEE